MRRLALILLATSLPAAGLAQSLDDEWAAGDVATPPSSAPAETPPAPPANPPPPAQEQPAPQTPAGQWVYTQQYGWVWMPYGDAYSYVPPEGIGAPYEYVYYPVYGWTWVVAPWVWGFGPWPYFAIGPTYFGWYHHGWWRTPWRWRYRPVPLRGHFAAYGPYRGGFAPRTAPYPYRGGFVGSPAPGSRPAPAWRGSGRGPGGMGGGHGRGGRADGGRR